MTDVDRFWIPYDSLSNLGQESKLRRTPLLRRIPPPGRSARRFRGTKWGDDLSTTEVLLASGFGPVFDDFLCYLYVLVAIPISLHELVQRCTEAFG